MATDNVEEFGDAENTDFETVFVLAEFDCPQYQYLYKRDNRIVGPPVVLQCAMKNEVSDSKQRNQTTREESLSFHWRCWDVFMQLQ